MKKSFTLFILLFAKLFFAQETPKFPLPAGIYETFQDFRTKSPTETVGIMVTEPKNNVSTGFKIQTDKGKKVKKAFAVSNGEDIFIRAKKMKAHFALDNRGNPEDKGRDYSLAYLENYRYLYFENYFYSTGTALLGAGMMHLRGVVFDENIGKFIVFKYGSDVEEFLRLRQPELTTKYDLTEKKINIETVRAVMLELLGYDQAAFD